MKATPRHVVISDQEHGLPYSKGLMAARITATGLAPARAFHVAEVIEDRLHDLDRAVISQSELTAMAEAALREEVGDRYAVSFAKWQSINRLESPLVILLGGATGVGKSTIATMLASRLGITRIIPTDAIREVMRSMFSENLLPTLQTSSFSADSVVRHPLP
ncbi:MAG: zeta toxin family protein, partial [Acidimicrobiales bacterium]